MLRLLGMGRAMRLPFCISLPKRIGAARWAGCKVRAETVGARRKVVAAMVHGLCDRGQRPQGLERTP